MTSIAQLDDADEIESPSREADYRARRILFADHTATLGGGEIALLNLVTNLDRSRYTPVVVLFSDGPLAEKLESAGVELHVLPLAPSVVNVRKDSLGKANSIRIADVCRTASYIWKLRRFMKQAQVELVHTNSLKADIIAGTAARLAGVPLVWHIRDRIADDYLPKRVCQVFRWVGRWLPNFVIANSRATLSTLDLRTRGTAIYSGTSSGSTRQIIHDGTRLETAPSETVATPWHAPRVGLVGRIAPWKGQHVFVAAAAIVKKRFPACSFQIIGSVMFGEKEYEQSVLDLVKQEGLENEIEFTGFREDVPKLIAGLDVLVHASTTGEPFGQVIIEGMAASKPIVATRGGGVPEIVEDGVTGLLVPMDDANSLARAIETLLADPALAAKMGAAGFERVQKQFTIAQTADRVQDVYDLILSKSEEFSPAFGL